MLASYYTHISSFQTFAISIREELGKTQNVEDIYIENGKFHSMDLSNRILGKDPSRKKKRIDWFIQWHSQSKFVFLQLTHPQAFSSNSSIEKWQQLCYRIPRHCIVVQIKGRTIIWQQPAMEYRIHRSTNHFHHA